MKKKLVWMICLWCFLLCLFSSCNGEAIVIADGTYRAEYEDFDRSGYKDFVEITFEDGRAVSVRADALAADGSLKSQSDECKNNMEKICGTYPEKYYRDLINQYLEKGDSKQVDIVAGATATSESFKVLAYALEQAVRNGDTQTVIVPRP